MTFKGTIQISKVAAAQRQLDAAIRLFFQREDELAIHTVAAAALGILRDLIKRRGRHFTKEVLRTGISSLAKQYVAGKLPPDKKALIEGSTLMTMIQPLIDSIRAQGDDFDTKGINVVVTKQQEHKLWLSRATSFLKHADRDADDFLTAEGLDNEKMLMAASAAYLELMKRPTPEITAYFAFWAATKHEVRDLAPEVQKFARQLEDTDAVRRYDLCVKFIRNNKKLASGPNPLSRERSQ